MKTIVSLTSIPSRFHNIPNIIDSVLNQTITPDTIELWVSREYKRIEKNNKLPELKKYKNLEVSYVEDIGPLTKIYYSIKKHYNDDVNIITIDDDVIYPNTFIEKLLEYEALNPNKAIGYRGRILVNKLDYNTSRLVITNNSVRNVDIITGTWGALYKPSFFKKNFFNLTNDKSIFMVDDIWITGNLADNNIERIVIPNCGITPDVKTCNIDALWFDNSKGFNNNKGLNYFKNVI